MQDFFASPRIKYLSNHRIKYLSTYQKSTESFLPGLRKSDMGSPYLPDFRNGGNNPPISGFTGPYLYLVREPPCISDNSPMTNVLLFIGKRFRTSPPRALSARAARAWPVSTKHISWGPTLHMACLQIMMDKILWLQGSSSLDGF